MIEDVLSEKILYKEFAAGEIIVKREDVAGKDIEIHMSTTFKQTVSKDFLGDTISNFSMCSSLLRMSWNSDLSSSSASGSRSLYGGSTNLTFILNAKHIVSELRSAGSRNRRSSLCVTPSASWTQKLGGRYRAKRSPI